MRRYVPTVLAAVVLALACFSTPASAQTIPTYPGGNLVAPSAPDDGAAAPATAFLGRFTGFDLAGLRGWLAPARREFTSSRTPLARQAALRRDRTRLR